MAKSMSDPLPRYTRLGAMDTVSWLYHQRGRSQRAAQLWRRLAKLLDEPVRRTRETGRAR